MVKLTKTADYLQEQYNKGLIKAEVLENGVKFLPVRCPECKNNNIMVLDKYEEGELIIFRYKCLNNSCQKVWEVARK
ncbi:MAG: hypothetical protein ACOC44_12355 [Promethearchaeia archaeon]